MDSCSGTRTLAYFIPNNETQKIIQNEINNLKSFNREIIFVLDKDQSNYVITLVPVTNRFIQNFDIRRTNRKIALNNSRFDVVFGFDYELGVEKEVVKEDGEDVTRYHKKVQINEYSTKLYFDQNWNFIKKG